MGTAFRRDTVSPTKWIKLLYTDRAGCQSSILHKMVIFTEVVLQKCRAACAVRRQPGAVAEKLYLWMLP